METGELPQGNRELVQGGGELAKSDGELVEGNFKISWRGFLENGELPYAPNFKFKIKYCFGKFINRKQKILIKKCLNLSSSFTF